MSLRYNILKLRGYEPYRYVQVRSSWDGEAPFDYWTELKMIKGLKVKRIVFKRIKYAEELELIVKRDFYGDGR